DGIPRKTTPERRPVEGERAREAIFLDLQVGDGDGHVESDLKDELRLIAEPLGHDDAGSARVEMHEHAGTLQQGVRDLFLRRKLARRVRHLDLAQYPARGAIAKGDLPKL